MLGCSKIKKPNVKGFTLVELIIVMAIIAVLATAAVVSIASISDRAAKALVESELSKYKLAYDAWLADTGGGEEQDYLDYIDPVNGSANYKITSGITPTINWTNLTVEVTIKSTKGRISLENGDVTWVD